MVIAKRVHYGHVVANSASKLIGFEQQHLSSTYIAALKRKATQILYDPPAHLLNESCHKLPLGRYLKVPLVRKSIFTKLFIPSAILIMNAKF